MPLIILTGYPSSGKSKRSNELAEFFRGRGKTVHVVCENSAIPKAGYTKNGYYADSQKEKVVRADLKSEAVRLLTKDNVVILDAGNYIKGTIFFFIFPWQGTSCNKFFVFSLFEKSKIHLLQSFYRF